jgi:hypothetical protein
MLFAEDEMDWSAAGCPQRTSAGIIYFHPVFHVRGMPNIETAIGALHDVDEEGICSRRCAHGKSPLDSPLFLRKVFRL